MSLCSVDPMVFFVEEISSHVDLAIQHLLRGMGVDEDSINAEILKDKVRLRTFPHHLSSLFV